MIKVNKYFNFYKYDYIVIVFYHINKIIINKYIYIYKYYIYKIT